MNQLSISKSKLVVELTVNPKGIKEIWAYLQTCLTTHKSQQIKELNYFH